MELNDLKKFADKENLENLKEKAAELAHNIAEKSKELGSKINNETVHNFSEKVKGGATKIENALRDLPGAAIDKADDNKTNPGLVKERTQTLNNNPRNNDM